MGALRLSLNSSDIVMSLTSFAPTSCLNQVLRFIQRGVYLLKSDVSMMSFDGRLGQEDIGWSSNPETSAGYGTISTTQCV